MTKTFTLRAMLAMSVSTAALGAYAPAMAQAADDATLETLVVTANRREESVNTIGMAIQAFRGEQMRELHVTTVKDLASVVPSFSVSQSY